MDMIQGMVPHLGMKVSPRLVAASYILELSSQELQQAITEELNDNPALELLERATCSVCGSALEGSICPRCLRQQKIDQPSDEADFTEEYFSSYSLSGGTGEEDFDPLNQVAAQMTLSERLMMELQGMLPKSDLPIAEYLVGSLNDNGYLTCTVEEVAEFFGVPVRRVELVLGILQSLEPIGIGSRNIQECLLIQLSYLAQDGLAIPPYAQEIVTDHLHELAEHKYGKLASILGCSTDAVAEASEFIKQRLNPYPAQEAEKNEPGSAKGGAIHVLPDVIISSGEQQDRFDVEVVESKRFFLRVSPLYNQLLNDVEKEAERFSEDEKRHIQHYVSRAKLFIANINQRRQTLHKITQAIAEAQTDYLSKGVRFLKPLTRATVARELGMHESTVSRATASKYVMVPSGEVIPFSNFFTASLSVRDVIKEMIGDEDSPLTDQEIAAKLANRGIIVARRTVAKYREQLGILPSSLR
ncbi:MAG: RNA polymerase factor sigma-54 [Chloroflexi bacterium]|nr:RNA polymerase factor sigma-54 [Chloroflexota bacterium]